MRRSVKINILPFLCFFLCWAVILFVSKGYAVDGDGTVSMEPFKYLHNLLRMPVVLVMMLAGVVLVLYSLYLGAFSRSRKGIWFGGAGTVLVVMSVFFLAGFNGTAYYPSTTDLQSSLTIANSSSSFFTLKVMTYVSLLIPFVVAYIAYAWHSMDRKKITPEEIEGPSDKY
jgi:cytochrome d ubiquinol oxidase subunit II